MIDHAEIHQNDMVLDIGAGKGALTLPLSRLSKRVIAVERDEQLAGRLKKTFSKQENVKILGMDIRNMPLPGNPFKVVSNIPYSITTDVFGKLMDSPETNFQGGTVIIEMGAAKRITQKHSSNPRVAGWNTWHELKIIRRVSRSAFHPPPTVNSALIKITRRKNLKIEQHRFYDYIAFLSSLLQNPGQPAKQALRSVFTKTQVKRIMKDAKIGRNALIKDLTIPQWVHCFNVMAELIPRRAQPGMPGKYKKLYKKS